MVADNEEIITHKFSHLQITLLRLNSFIMMGSQGVWGGGYSDIFFTYISSGHYFGFKILNFNILGGVQKNEYFWGYEDFVGIFGGSFLCILGSEWGIYFGLVKFQMIFWSA